ncbi:MAG: hypothetical protein BGO12_11985 [Verrucomicrobia bacterium 61-8]|nr:MAG: hypothetical protein BGO12_11985 [Verrucomicrobia bacterium 61-8]
MNLRLASLFQNHAILQRDQPLPVWGWAEPGALLRISLGGHVAVTQAGASGDFLVRMPALPAGGPHILSVTIPATGETLEISDILIGEVWLASGQSNMEMTLESCLPVSADDIAAADFPEIRFFNIPKRAHLGPERTVEGEWVAMNPTAARQCSATAFSFARRLYRALGVPVGVISSSWGGSNIKSWLSRSALASNPDTAQWLADFEKVAWTEDRWEAMSNPDPDGRVCNLPKDPGNTGIERGWHLPGAADSDWQSIHLPATWQSAGHPNTGVFWFRRTVEIPAFWLGRELVLNLGAADKQDITYVNGLEVGRTGKDREDAYWNQPRIYTVPAALVDGPTLNIAVRVYSFVYDGGLTGPAAVMNIHPAGSPAECLGLSGEWKCRREHDLGLVLETHLMGQGERNTPHILFDNMIQPLIPYALRGAIWYQGESNASEHHTYAQLQRDLIEDWRRQWGLPGLAFHLVQLPGFKTPQDHEPESTWARLREAQADALALPGVGMAITLNLGDADDIHPKDKMPVGERLAQSALAITYGAAVTATGPILDRIEIDGSQIVCIFRNADSGLVTMDQALPRPFFMAGTDRVFHPAEAVLKGNTVSVKCPAVTEPVAVRYAWADNPAASNLASSEGLPASPFRTDNW